MTLLLEQAWTLLGVGLGTYAIGAAWYLIQQWQRHGFTHVKVFTLATLVVGSALLGFSTALLHHPIVSIVASTPLCALVVICILKRRDSVRTRRR